MWGTDITSSAGTGLYGAYYNDNDDGNADFMGLVAERIDSAVDFDWGSSAPDGAKAVGTKWFTVRWTGSIKTKNAGTYKFKTVTDDGVRLEVAGKRIIDDWVATDGSLPGHVKDNAGDINLDAYTHYPIVMEYFQNDPSGPVHSSAKLSWIPPGETLVIIPTAQLYPYGIGSYDWDGDVDGNTATVTAAYVTTGQKNATLTVEQLPLSRFDADTISCSPLEVVDFVDLKGSKDGGATWKDGPIDKVPQGVDVAMVKWESEDMHHCVGDTEFSTGGLANGQTTVDIVLGENKFDISCYTDAAETEPPATDSVVINGVTTDMSLTSNLNRVRRNGSVKLTWDTGGRIQCSITGDGTTHPVTVAEGATDKTVTAKTTYTLACTDPGNTGQVDVTVDVLPLLIEY